VAAIGALVALAGLVGLLRPVSTPVQDCGLAAAFLLDGRTDRFVDPSDPPAGVTAAEATDNNQRPCRERVADVARPAAVALLAGITIGITAAIIEVSARITLRRQRHHERAASEGADAAGAAVGGAGPAEPPSAP
jgi:hypothetical protein